MSLLSGILDGIRGWVLGLLDSAGATLRSWVSSFISALTSALNTLGASWDNFRTKTWVDWTTAFTALGASWDNFRTKTWVDMLAARKAREDALEALIEKRKRELETTTREGDAATRSWVTEILGPAILHELENIPARVLGPVVNLLIDSWSRGGAESFWRGLEKGLKEEEG